MMVLRLFQSFLEFLKDKDTLNLKIWKTSEKSKLRIIAKLQKFHWGATQFK